MAKRSKTSEFGVTSASEIILCITLGKLLNIISLYLSTSKMGNNKEFYLFHRVIMKIKLDNIVGQWFSPGGNFALPPRQKTSSMSGDSFGCHYWRIGRGCYWRLIDKGQGAT